MSARVGGRGRGRGPPASFSPTSLDGAFAEGRGVVRAVARAVVALSGALGAGVAVLGVLGVRGAGGAVRGVSFGVALGATVALGSGVARGSGVALGVAPHAGDRFRGV